MDYDAVVIGAGNAGLAAALDLVRNGWKTLLLEQHNLPGGCATSFVRGRFEIEPSLHELCSVGTAENPSSVRSLFREAGVEMEWERVPDCFRAIGTYSDGSPLDVTMPSGRDAFIEKLVEYVPDSRESVEKLFLLFDECQSGLDYFSEKTEYDVKYAFEHFPNMLRVGSYDTLRVFASLGLPQKAVDILSIYWSYLGVELDDMAFLHYASLVKSYVEEGAYVPRHTSQEMSQKLLDAFRRLGGEVWFSTRALEILFEGDKVSGVRTTMGEVKARGVLADLNTATLYGKLLSKDRVPEKLRRLSAAREGQFGGRMLTAYFCLDVPPEEVGIKDYCIFLMDSADSRKEYKSIMGGLGTNRFAIFLTYNIANPYASPEGTAICSFTTFGSPEEWGNLEPKDYFNRKDLWAGKFLDLLEEKAGIVLRGHIEELEVATPWTFARYLGTPEGSVYGHETRGWDDIISRHMAVEEEYPFKGLYQMGADGPRGDGYPCAYISGRMMAARLERDLKEGEDA